MNARRWPALLLLAGCAGPTTEYRAVPAWLIPIKPTVETVQRRSARMRDDPAGRRRDCVGHGTRQPSGDARPPGAARPAVLDAYPRRFFGSVFAASRMTSHSK